MDKKEKLIYIVTGIIVIISLGLTFNACITGNTDLAGKFAISVLVIVLGAFFINKIVFSSFKYKALVDRMRAEERIKVHKQKALPIYSNFFVTYSVTAILLIGFLLFLGYVYNIEERVFLISIFGFVIISLLILYLKTRQQNVLYLIKDLDIVKEYKDNVEYNPLLLADFSEQGAVINKKSEMIELINNIKFWSYNIVYMPFRMNEKNKYYITDICALINYNSSAKINIKLTNKVKTLFTASRIHVSKYSNLLPYMIVNDDSIDFCSKIDKECSDFFARTRHEYYLIISGGAILLGLSHARFGKNNKIFNKNRTVELTKEAIEEISEFLIKIKSIIEN